MIKALICDLDDTIFPTALIPESTMQPGIAALVAENSGANKMDESTLQRVLDDCWSMSFDKVSLKYGLPDRFRQAWALAHAAMRVKSLSPYPDVMLLAELSMHRFLVTTGYRHFQESKIQALGIAHLFSGIFIDALDEPTTRKGKAGIFLEILERFGFAPQDVAVIGDSAESELAAGNELGMTTIQIMRSGADPARNVRFSISTFAQLPALFQTL